MKTLKVILTVFLTIIIVATCFATEIIALANVSVLNPNFYKKTLSNNGFYDNVRLIMVSYINGFVDQQGAIPDEFKDDAYQITENVFSKESFSSQLGEFLGGSVSYVLYDEGDSVIPINIWIDSFIEEIDNSTLVDDIAEYNLSIGETDDQQAYRDALYPVVRSTYTGFLGAFTGLFTESDNLSDFIKLMYPTEEMQKKVNAKFDQLRIWVKWSNRAMYAGFAAIIFLCALVLLIWKKKIGKAYKMLGTVFIINSILLVIVGSIMLMSISILDLMNKLPSILTSYKGLAQSAINSIAVLTLIEGAVVLLIGIFLSVFGGAMIRKKAEAIAESETDTIDTKIQEIDYSEDSETEQVDE